MPRKQGNTTLQFRFNGKRYSVTAPTRDEAIARKAIRIKELEDGARKLSKSATVNEWIETWLVTYKQNKVNAAWFRDIKGICRNYIIPSVGNIKISSVKPVQLQMIINSNVKSKTFNGALFDIIKGIFKTAYQNGMTNEDITVSLQKAIATPPKKRRSITDEERAVLLHVLENHRGKMFCYLMLYAGLRPGECAALLWSDVDMDKRVIHVCRALKSDGTIKPWTKTSAGMREIPIQNTLYKALCDAKNKGLSHVCVNSNGNIYTKKAIFLMWENIRREMDIEMGAELYRNKIVKSVLADDFMMYNLRHTFCTDLQSAGVPINVARELMGHSNISVTAQIYTHHSEQSYLDALEKMNKLNDNE